MTVFSLPLFTPSVMFRMPLRVGRELRTFHNQPIAESLFVAGLLGDGRRTGCAIITAIDIANIQLIISEVVEVFCMLARHHVFTSRVLPISAAQMRKLRGPYLRIQTQVGDITTRRMHVKSRSAPSTC